MIFQSSCLSEVDVKLSKVHVLLSEINQTISECPNLVQSRKLLPRVNVILSEITLVVSFAQTDCSSSIDEDNDDITSLEWDSYNNYNYYDHLYFDNNFDLSSMFDDHDDVGGDDINNNVEGDRDGDQEDVEGGRDGDHEDVEGGRDDDHEDVEGVHDNDREEVEGVQDDQDEADMNIAQRVVMRRRYSATTTDPSHISKSSTTPAENTSSAAGDGLNNSLASPSPSTTNQANNCISSLLTFISRIAPGDVFSASKSVRRRKRRMMKAIHPVLRCLFKHSLDLFTQAPSPGPVPYQRPPVPVVDWTRVNERSLGNLPKPQMFPKLGCSDDPNIYADRIHDHGAHGRINTGTIHAKEPYPFGVDYGFMTDLGVISVNKGDHMEDPYQHVIQGHVWSRELHRWVIHAKYVKDKDKNSKEVKKKAGAIVPKKPRRKELR